MKILQCIIAIWYMQACFVFMRFIVDVNLAYLYDTEFWISITYNSNDSCVISIHLLVEPAETQCFYSFLLKIRIIIKGLPSFRLCIVELGRINYICRRRKDDSNWVVAGNLHPPISPGKEQSQNAHISPSHDFPLLQSIPPLPTPRRFLEEAPGPWRRPRRKVDFFTQIWHLCRWIPFRRLSKAI